jgi:hypothetical protein
VVVWSRLESVFSIRFAKILIRGEGGYPLAVIDSRFLDDISFVGDIVYSMIRPRR